MHSRGPLGVGLVGAGAVTQAIHLPTLARLRSEFRVAHVSDIDSQLAGAVAAAADARSSETIEALLADDDVEVVAVCSPHHLHVAHVLAALRAGKAVLCEKPLALERPGLAELSSACTASGVPLLIGWMHLYDPIVTAALAAWHERGESANAIRLSAVLPGNARFEDAATEVRRRPPPQRGPAARDARAAVCDGLLTLAVHDLPLVRRLLPHGPGGASGIRVMHASPRSPSGYLVLAEIGGVRVELHAMFGQAWKPVWTLEATSARARLRIAFPPSYVHAGSASASIGAAEGRLAWSPVPEDGYHREWLRLAQSVRAGERGGIGEALEDSEFVLDVADAAERAMTDVTT